MPTLSANTQAVLLLTSPLLQEGGRGSGMDPVLTAAEYAELAAVLRNQCHEPADLIHGSRDALLDALCSAEEAERLNRLLSRGFQLSQAIEHWATRSISVIGRADAAYPQRFKRRLKRAAPPLLYACGNLALLRAPILAVVGSRGTPEALLRRAEAVGALAAAAGVVIASGAAKGVDETAMVGSLAADGCAIGVVADSLELASARPIWRQGLLDGRLLLLSSEAPSARFQVWRAIGRNKLIYALADAALVVSAAEGEGGTWAGASEQLQRLHCCPIHVLNDPRGGPGLSALAAIGAHPWPEPTSAEALQTLLRRLEPLAPSTAIAPEPVRQPSLLETGPARRTTDQEQDPAAALAAFVDELVLRCLHEPRNLEELALLLDVSKTEVRRWCQRLVEQGRIRKLAKPVRYVRLSRINAPGRLTSEDPVQQL
jgi:predicted Rossmann fold nucleotide-binding protein DprA/Smf involved in DNA uptake